MFVHACLRGYTYTVVRAGARCYREIDTVSDVDCSSLQPFSGKGVHMAMHGPDIPRGLVNVVQMLSG